ncbi:hypothetical protein D9M69_685800 [compost metagenome]
MDRPVLVRREVELPEVGRPYVDPDPPAYDEPLYEEYEEYEERYDDRPPQAGQLAAAADER